MCGQEGGVNSQIEVQGDLKVMIVAGKGYQIDDCAGVPNIIKQRPAKAQIVGTTGVMISRGRFPISTAGRTHQNQNLMSNGSFPEFR